MRPERLARGFRLAALLCLLALLWTGIGQAAHLHSKNDLRSVCSVCVAGQSPATLTEAFQFQHHVAGAAALPAPGAPSLASVTLAAHTIRPPPLS